MIGRKQKKFRLLVICGGPSPERGISLNSCRSVVDHLSDPAIDIQAIYVDVQKRHYLISTSALYSNTPSDFDFKLTRHTKKLTQRELASQFKNADLVFPIIHGAYGEDGQLQQLLERKKTSFVGSSSRACKTAFNKFKANELIRENGFPSLPSDLLKSHLPKFKNLEILEKFFSQHKLKRAIVKPVAGGSSIGVHSVTTPMEAFKAMQDIFSKKLDTQAVIEPFCEGREFTVVILQNRFGQPVALIPSEIETSYNENQIFDFRKKYLATRKVRYHCPPRFEHGQIEKIQIMAEQLFSLLGMRHFGRFDGWLLPDGRIWFSDFNPISGMEQNSFLFQQASQIGMSHRDVLMHILKTACAEYGLQEPKMQLQNPQGKKRINVIGGGTSAERQVSLMSATNVWLKLRQSKKYWPELFLMTGDDEIWHTPYNFSLNHTVEEIHAMLKDAEKNEEFLRVHREKVLLKLALADDEAQENLFSPRKMTLKEFMDIDGFVFLGLHGGIGEDGTMQELLATHKKHFNGSRAQASQLCMDKYKTGERLNTLVLQEIYTAEKKVFTIDFFDTLKNQPQWQKFWIQLKKDLRGGDYIVKPVDDGCSAGICRISTYTDLQKYIDFAKSRAQEIPEHTLKDQHGIIEMPAQAMKHIMLERFIRTDKALIANNKLRWDKKTDWIEVTVGVLGKKGKLHAFNPSMTVSMGHILSLEEKFQGGTGINITPPPEPFVKKEATEKAKQHIEMAANTLGIEGYARLDAFMHTQTGEVYIIEANTLPALTPSTVIFHQSLAEPEPIYPRELLEKIIELG